MNKDIKYVRPGEQHENVMIETRIHKGDVDFFLNDVLIGFLCSQGCLWLCEFKENDDELETLIQAGIQFTQDNKGHSTIKLGGFK